MPRRKKANSRKGATRRTASTGSHRWGVFLAGLVAGVLLSAGGMYIYASGMKMTFGAGIKNLISNRAVTTENASIKSVEKADEPKPVFDFYTVLPEYETVVDEKQFIREPDKPGSIQQSQTSYILQAASYSSFKDADMLKAKLALNGLSSRIEKISVEGKGQYYRVRLGPYSSTRTKKDVVKRLGALGIKPLHLKVEGKD